MAPAGLPPGGTVELVINLDDDTNRVYDRENVRRFERYRGPLVCGPHAAHFVIDTALRTGKLIDPFGRRWMITTERKKVAQAGAARQESP